MGVQAPHTRGCSPADRLHESALPLLDGGRCNAGKLVALPESTTPCPFPERKLKYTSTVLPAVLFLLLGLCMPTARAANPDEACKALYTTDFAAIEDAPSEITAAEFVAADLLPPHCKVSGYVAPSV